MLSEIVFNILWNLHDIYEVAIVWAFSYLYKLSCEYAILSFSDIAWSYDESS